MITNLRPKHLTFAMIYIQHRDPELAYKTAYPKSRPSSWAAGASRLLARPDIAGWIAATEERIHFAMLQRLEEEEGSRRSHQLLSLHDKRDILARIITGQVRRRRYIATKQGVQQVSEDLPTHTILRAIDLDTRLDMLYNYLLQHHGKAPQGNTYINAPTLQQQVNILISRTMEQSTEAAPPADDKALLAHPRPPLANHTIQLTKLNNLTLKIAA